MAQGQLPAITATGPAVDPDVIRRLHDDVGGDAAITRDVLRSYLDRAPELAAALTAASHRRDSDGVRQAAHDLRSISAFVGATTIHALATSIESEQQLSATELHDVAGEIDRQLIPTMSELRRLANAL